jgi:hypothetical protein
MNFTLKILTFLQFPGHAASWNAGYPYIMADCFDKYYYNINDFALNPIADETYTVLQGVALALLFIIIHYYSLLFIIIIIIHYFHYYSLLSLLSLL